MKELRIEYRVENAPILNAYVQDRGDLTAIMGPFGSGKTSASVVKMGMMACETPVDEAGIRRSRIMVVRNTYPELRKNTIKSFLKWFPECVVMNGRIRKPGW